MTPVREELGSISVCKEVPEASDVDAEQLQFRAKIRPSEAPMAIVGMSEVEGKNVCHFDARRYDPKRLVFPAGTFSHGVNVWNRCSQPVISDKRGERTRADSPLIDNETSSLGTMDAGLVT